MTFKKKSINNIKSFIFDLKAKNSNTLHCYSFFKSSTVLFFNKFYLKLLKIIYYILFKIKKIFFVLKKNIFFKTNTLKLNVSKNYFYYTNPYFYATLFSFIKKVGYVQIKKEMVTYYKYLILLFLLFIKLSFKIINFKKQIIFLPKKYTTKTVLRSPHIDKRSREQFEKRSNHSFFLLPFFLKKNTYSIFKYEIPLFGNQLILKTTNKR